MKAAQTTPKVHKCHTLQKYNYENIEDQHRNATHRTHNMIRAMHEHHTNTQTHKTKNASHT